MPRERTEKSNSKLNDKTNKKQYTGPLLMKQPESNCETGWQSNGVNFPMFSPFQMNQADLKGLRPYAEHGGAHHMLDGNSFNQLSSPLTHYAQWVQDMPILVRLSKISEHALDMAMMQYRDNPQMLQIMSRLTSRAEAGVRSKKVLEQLTARGYCTEKKIGDVLQRLADIDYPACVYACMLSIADDLLKKKEFDAWFNKRSSEVWTQAIETVCCLLDRERFMALNGELDASWCEEHISAIYLRAAAIVYNCVLAEHVIQEKENRLTASERKKIEKQHHKEREKAEEREKKLEGDKKKLVAEIDRQNEQIRKLEKQLRAKDAENRRLIEVFDAFERANLISEEEEERECAESPIEEIEEDYSDVVIPEDRSVIFLGGNINFINKMRSKHPHWRYISDDERESLRIAQSSTSKISCIILYSKHVSHATAINVISAAGSDVPIIYLNSLNAALVDKTIKKGFAEIQKAGKNV